MTTDAVGGVWNYALSLCRELAAQNVEVLLAVLGPAPRSSQRAEFEQLANVTIHERNLRLEWMEDPWSDVDQSGGWLLELANEFCPDVVHLNGYSHAALPWTVPVLVVAHSCVLSWWRAVHNEDAPPRWDEYRRRAGAGIRAADLVVAPSRFMLQQVTEIYGRPGESLVIHNGSDPARFSWYTKTPFILTVGRIWDEAKNVAAMAAVAPRVSWPIRIAGDTGVARQAASDWPNVDLLGRRESRPLAELYGQASIYALPAKYEPFGLSILEAALSGCALVLGDIPSLRELWNDAALFVSPTDSDALEAGLNALIADTPRRHALAAHALERAGTYSAKAMGDAYGSAYGTLLNGGKKSARSPGATTSAFA
jgi:glycogen(starch) synthase